MVAYLRNILLLLLLLGVRVLAFSQCTPNITGTPKFCPGQSTTLEVSNTFDTYSWSTNSITHTTQVNTPGWVYVTVTRAGCTGVDSVLVTVSDNVTADITASATTVCQGDNVSLSVSGAGAGGSYVWGAGLGSNQIVNPIVSSTTTYSVTSISADNCTAVGEITITAVDTPTLALIPLSRTLCRGQSVTLQAAGAEMYTWFPNYQLNTNVGPAVVATPEYTTEYTLTGSNSQNGKTCSATKKTLITVDNYKITLPLPEVTCEGETRTIIATQENGTAPYLYSWYVNGSLKSAGSLVFNTEINGETEINLVAVDNNGCSDSKKVLYKNYPPLVLNAFVNKDSVCPGEPVLFNASIDGGTGAPYQFLFDGEYSNTILTVYPKQTHEYIIEARDGCGPKRKKITIFTHPIPQIDFSSSRDTVCANTEIQFKSVITPPNSVKAYKWNFGDKDNFSGLKDPVHKYKHAGWYDVSLQVVSNEGCVADSTKKKMIKIQPGPIVGFSANHYETDILHPEIIFTNESLKLDSLSYIWDFGEGNASLLKHPDYTYINPGVYTVSLKGINRFGCWAVDSSQIKVKPVMTLFMPTAFTPDGDIHNRFFTPRGTNISTEDYQFVVYDRYGDEVFSTTDLSEGWDGNYQKGGNPAKQGTYVYFVRFKDDVTQEFQERTGQFVLFR